MAVGENAARFQPDAGATDSVRIIRAGDASVFRNFSGCRLNGQRPSRRTHNMSLARQLAERVTALRHEDFPPEATAWGKVAVLDTLVVTLAGSAEEAPRIVEDVLELQSGDGPCLVFGASRRVRALDAALVNGTAAHALDYDNTAKNLGGHVSAGEVPPPPPAAGAPGPRGPGPLPPPPPGPGA